MSKYLCVFNVYSVLMYERECAPVHPNVSVYECLSVFVFFASVRERECPYTKLIQNVYVCR